MSSSLRRYLVTRALMTIPMVIILVTLIFFIMRVLPGDPIRSQLGPRVSEEQAEDLRERLGLNRPLLVQYVDFIGDMITFDFGNALTQGERPIRDELGERLPATIELTIPAITITAIFGILSGAYAAKNRKKPIDYIIRLLSIVMSSIPHLFHGFTFSNWIFCKSSDLPTFRADGYLNAHYI